MPIQVAIVEDNPGFLKTLEGAVLAAGDMRLHSVADDLPAGLLLLDGPPADVLLVDLDLPSGSGLELIARAKKQWPTCEVMVITVFADSHSVLQAIKAGATGYLLKDDSPDSLADQIRLIRSDGSPLSPSIAREMLAIMKTGYNGAPDLAVPPGEPAPITPQEQTVLSLAYKGYNYEEIAEKMGISRHTVHTYVKRCYAKLQVRSKTAAIYEAQRLGVHLG